MISSSSHESIIPLLHEDRQVPDTPQNELDHAAASDPTAPINTERPLSERIAALKARQQEGESGEGSAMTSGQSESSNTSTTAASATRDASDPQQSAGSASTSHIRSDASVAAGASLLRGAQPTGEPAPGTDTKTVASQLGQDTARISDGSKTGERVRATSTSVIPESNDVMLGDQSTRKDGSKDTTTALPTTDANALKEDGSKSPHDATSEGSRQAMAHNQLRDLQNGAEQDETPPAFRAEAKARTI